MAFLFSKRYPFFLFERPYYKGFFPFLPSVLEIEEKLEFDFLFVHMKKKKCNESNLTKEAPEMKVKITYRKSAERVCGNTLLLLHYSHKCTMFFSEE